MTNPANPAINPADTYAIVLPCDPGHFRDFIAGLLGKPQTINKSFGGPFDITKDEVENFYHLVSQRVTQQNEATLIQFSVRVVYDDSSSVLLNSLLDFQRYNEIRPISSIAAHLSWNFLVKFQDRDVPEKQQIDVSIQCQGQGRGPVFEDDGSITFPFNTNEGSISLRIQHTARTWGTDIEALLTGHIQTLIHPPHPIRRLISCNSENVGLAIGVSFFVAALVSSIFSTQRFVHARMEDVKALAQLSPSDPAATSKKVDHIIGLMASGMWPRFFYYLACFLLVAFVLAIVLGIWAAVTAGKKEPSFVTFSKHAEKRKQRLLKKDKASRLSFICSIVISVITSAVGSYLFAYYFQGWRP